MLEEAGYNPFVDGEEDKEEIIETGPQSRQSLSANLGHGFLESIDFNSKRRSSFAESPVSSARQSPTFPHDNISNGSPSLKLSFLPRENSAQSLENPFVNDIISLDDDEPIPVPLPISSSSPLSRSTERLPSPPISLPRTPLSPRKESNLTNPRSPLGMSSTILNDSSLFTVQSPPTPRAVVTSERAEWVSDTYSNLCEHCGDEFTFLRRRHHCRVCGHLFCGECIVRITLPVALGFTAAQKACVRCAYKAVRTRGNFSCTIKDGDGLSIGQRVAGKMQSFIYSLSGMREGGRFDRFAAHFISTNPFSLFESEEVTIKIPTGDSQTISAHAYIPKGDGPYSILVYIPGGLFVLDNELASASFCKELCCKVGCIVVSISYRLAPEHPYPAAWEDCYAAVKWIYEGSALDLPKLEKDPKIAVCGESSGALLAASVCLMARDRGSPPIQYSLLITPWLNLTTLNLEKFTNSYILTKELMAWVLKQVVKDSSEKPYLSPLSSSSLDNLPRTKIISANYDPMRNDAEEYAMELRKSDVNVSVTRYENSQHGFMGLNADTHDEREEAIFECVVALRELFGRGEPTGARNRAAGTDEKA